MPLSQPTLPHGRILAYASRTKPAASPASPASPAPRADHVHVGITIGGIRIPLPIALEALKDPHGRELIHKLIDREDGDRRRTFVLRCGAMGMAAGAVAATAVLQWHGALGFWYYASISTVVGGVFAAVFDDERRQIGAAFARGTTLVTSFVTATVKGLRRGLALHRRLRRHSA
jgi:hypothetical protein